MMIILTECDKCKKTIREREIYCIIFYRTKGESGIRKRAKTLCNKCCSKFGIEKLKIG